MGGSGHVNTLPVRFCLLREKELFVLCSWVQVATWRSIASGPSVQMVEQPVCSPRASVETLSHNIDLWTSYVLCCISYRNSLKRSSLQSFSLSTHGERIWLYNDKPSSFPTPNLKHPGGWLDSIPLGMSIFMSPTSLSNYHFVRS